MGPQRRCCQPAGTRGEGSWSTPALHFLVTKRFSSSVTQPLPSVGLTQRAWYPSSPQRLSRQAATQLGKEPSHCPCQLGLEPPALAVRASAHPRRPGRRSNLSSYLVLQPLGDSVRRSAIEAPAAPANGKGRRQGAPR